GPEPSGYVPPCPSGPRSPNALPEPGWNPPELPGIARIIAALEPVEHDRYLDDIWTMPIRRLVYGLIHSLSHAAMRAITRYAGIGRTSVAEYIFLPLLGFVVYDNSSSFKLGGIATLVRDHLAAFLQNI